MTHFSQPHPTLHSTTISIDSLTPRQIVAELDKFVIGQHSAKRAVAIALRNRWRRQQADPIIRDEIMPNNIILIGPTGVGKTEISRRLAKLAGAPFIKIEATKYTEVGFVGRDVESMIRDLADISVTMVRAEHIERIREKAKLHVEDRLLDILVMPIDDSSSFEMLTEEEKSERIGTREKFRQMLRDGKLEEKEIELDVTLDASLSMQIMGPFGNDEVPPGIQEMLSQALPKKKKRKKVKIVDARAILEKDEADKLIDHDSINREAIERCSTMGIVFIDEIDKIANKEGSSGRGPDISREGVQRDLLPIVEGSSVNTKHGVVKTDHVLFIASGAFHTTKPSDLIPELQGRFPIRVELKSLTEDDMVAILTEPENALLKQYKALLMAEGVEIEFDASAIREIAATATRVNDEIANIGARRLHTILTTLLDEILFDAPDSITNSKITITKEVVESRLKDIVENVDLSKFIL